MHTGAAVDLGRVLLAQDVDSHADETTARRRWSTAPRRASVGAWPSRPQPQESPRHRPRRRRGQAADAADRRPGQAGRAVRRASTGSSTSRCPTSSTPGYLKIVVLTQYKSHSLDRHVTHDLADVDAARQLRHAGAGPAAASGKRWYLGSADAIYQSPQPDPRRAARHRRACSAPTTSTGWTSRRWSTQHVESGAGVHGRRDPPADRAGRPVRRDRRATPTTRSRSATSSRSRPTRRACPTRPTRCWRRMGNYVFDADALVDAVTRDAERSTAPSTTWAATSSRRSSTQARPAVYDFKDNEVPGRDRPRPRLLARRRDARLLLRRPHGPGLAAAGLQPLQQRVADLHLLRPAPAGQARRGGQRRRASRPSTRSCRPASWSPAARCNQSVLSPGGVRQGRRRGVRLGADGRRRRSARARSCATRSSTRASSCPPGARIGVDHEEDRARGFVVDEGLTVLAKQQKVPES